MAILALGISYRRAPVDLLDRLAFTDEDYAKAYRRLLDEEAIGEAVILSTCNRVEVYADVNAYHGGFVALKRLLSEARGIEPEAIAEPLYSHYEDAAAEHLFTVAAGLDSMVLGEPQILSQVREAHRRAEGEGATNHVLTGLFHAAARAGRRVRSETGVGAAPDAIVEAGADLADEELGGLEGSRAVVVGAGHMAALAVKHLRARGVGPVRVLNRSLERARALAERTSAEHGHLSELRPALEDADLVVSATGAAGIVVDTDDVAGAMRDRPDRPMFLLDLAVPRDVEPTAGELAGVRVVDIAGLRETLEGRTVEVANEIAKAHEIVAEELHRFSIRQRSEKLAPVIRALRQRGDRVMASEQERFRRELSTLTPDEREAVEALARGIVSKLLHDPIVRLKERSTPGTEESQARTLADLFGIELPPE
jgi:glutamyl-tRNA reductase